MMNDYEIAFRLLLACILGGIVGWEREKIHKPAGLRTHILVALGSALVTIISIYAFTSINTLNKDPGRIAANIVTGIGFLGAGTIMREGLSVRGLTTAASIWVIAAIGMAVGSGMYISALVTTFLVFLTLDGFLERVFFRNHQILRLKLSSEFKVKEVGNILEKYKIIIKHVSILPINNSRVIPVEFTLNTPKKINIEQAIEEIKCLEGVLITKNHDDLPE